MKHFYESSQLCLLFLVSMACAAPTQIGKVNSPGNECVNEFTFMHEFYDWIIGGYEQLVQYLRTNDLHAAEQLSGELLVATSASSAWNKAAAAYDRCCHLGNPLLKTFYNSLEYTVFTRRLYLY